MAVHLWPQAPTESLGKLQDRLGKILQAQQVGRFRYQYRVLRKGDAKLQTLTTGDDKLHLLRGEAYCVLGSDFANVLARLKLWTERQTYKIEGALFMLDGAELKLGQVSQGPTTRGLVLEYAGSIDAALGTLRASFSRGQEEVCLSSALPTAQALLDLLQRL